MEIIEEVVIGERKYRLSRTGYGSDRYGLVIYVERGQIAYITRARSSYIGIRYSGDILGHVRGAKITWGIESA